MPFKMIGQAKMEAGRLSVLHRKHTQRSMPRDTDTRDAQLPNLALGDPFYIRRRM